MRVILTAASLHVEDGGPARSVPGLAASLARLGCEVHLVYGRVPGKTIVAVDRSVTTHELSESHYSLLGRLTAGGMRRKVLELCAAEPAAKTIVHTNGVWLRQYRGSIHAGLQSGARVVVSPRGMLEPWSLRHNRWKKRIAWFLYQKRDLQRVHGFHATADGEAQSLRRLGLKQPICIVPNAVELPARDAIPPAARRRREVLFLSRINPKKGLVPLLRAWGSLNPEGWLLRIAGNDDSGHLPELRELVRTLGIGEQVRFEGPAYGEDKAILFQQASVFVLPSFSENFGIAVAEALAFGLPVITTTGTPWSDLPRRGCGWHVDPDAEALEAALRSALALSPDQRQAAGEAGRSWVAECFTWDRAGRDLLEGYRWLHGRDAAPPANVQT
jgi:glycosyltransferase involved in cell wall biosynthesis